MKMCYWKVRQKKLLLSDYDIRNESLPGVALNKNESLHSESNLGGLIKRNLWPNISTKQYIYKRKKSKTFVNNLSW